LIHTAPTIEPNVSSFVRSQFHGTIPVDMPECSAKELHRRRLAETARSERCHRRVTLVDPPREQQVASEVWRRRHIDSKTKTRYGTVDFTWTENLSETWVGMCSWRRRQNSRVWTPTAVCLWRRL